MSTPSRLLSVLALSCAVLGCSKPEPEGPAANNQAAPATGDVATASDPAKPNPEAAITEATAPPEPTPNVPTPAIEPPPVEPAVPSVVPITIVAATDFTIAWREAASPSEALTFEPVTAGVLATGTSGVYTLDDSGQLVLDGKIEAWPDYADLVGEWPADVWYVERRTAIEDDRGDDWDELRLMRLRNGYRWVPQEYGSEQRFRDEGQVFVKGAKGGLIALYERDMVRIAGGSDDPVQGPTKGTELLAFTETNSGRLYTVTRAGELLYVQRDCAAEDLECVATNAIELPLGNDWEFGRAVPRQKHSVSWIANVDQEGTRKHHLLHYGLPGWQLDAMPSEPSGLWPTKDGGLWTRVGEQLWHRDSTGAWRNVGLPEGATAVSVAIREEPNELWIAAMVADKPVVFATYANAQEPPPAPAGDAPVPG